MDVANLFSPLPSPTRAEHVDDLLTRPGCRLKRIVSTGQATPPGEWLQQVDHEWVVLLTGRASLLIEGETEARRLEPGDYVLLPSLCRHRVEWTDPNQSTIWLALHFH